MKIEVDASQFARACLDLSKMSGMDFRDVLVDQVGHILGACIRYTSAAKASTLRKRAEYQNRSSEERERFKAGYYRTKNGKEWLSIPEGGRRKHYLLSHRLPGEKWKMVLALKQILEEKKIDVSAAVRSRGALKHTWYQIAKALGPGAESVANAPAYVRNANSFHGQEIPQVGTAQQIFDAAMALIEIANASRILSSPQRFKKRGKKVEIDGQKILQRSIDSRVRFFNRAVEQQWIHNRDFRLKHFPGIFTK